MAEFISQQHVPSKTARTLERTAAVAALDEKVRESIAAYFTEVPEGTQVTLRVLADLGKSELQDLARRTNRRFDEIKQCVGLRVPILLVEMFGASEVSTYRDPATKKASTRSRSANWPELDWVSRYTPHRVSSVGVLRVLGKARKSGP